GGALEPERHMYDELLYVLSGRGLTEVWSTDAGSKVLFEWQTGSLFAPPMNAWHRLINGSGNEPVRLLAVTSAPLVIDLYHSPEFVFGCDYQFSDRFDGRADYFSVKERVEAMTNFGQICLWDTNFIPDVRHVELAPLEQVGAGSASVSYEMSDNVLVGHMAEFPVGRYKKGHYHGGGAILLTISSQGYTLMWPKDVGSRPYESGHGEQVQQIPWQEGSVLSPPTGWFHQHFNTGSQPARQLALRYGSQKYGLQFHDIHAGDGPRLGIKQGGTQIDYEDEDPEIRRRFLEQLSAGGLQCEYSSP
ncbi:MAG TPA: ethanolamine ammonia lyase-activating protein, partial [Chloroflexota bacterium]|nr:ethanolamine ammonia lyase-activating protein [Chloroflexota bacterium]